MPALPSDSLTTLRVLNDHVCTDVTKDPSHANVGKSTCMGREFTEIPKF